MQILGGGDMGGDMFVIKKGDRPAPALEERRRRRWGRSVLRKEVRFS
jgi:hypothetical protein